MKKFTVYANCQGNILAQTLLENKEFSSNYELIPIPAVHTLSDKDIPDVLAKVKSVDLFIYQPISNQNRPKELSSDFLAAKTKHHSIVISFPSLYFDGYFPHLLRFKRYVSELNLVHDYIIAYCCSIGMDENRTMRLIQSEDLYPEEISVNLANQSIANLKSYEERFTTDITISGFIENNYRSKKLFNQFNHPKKTVFKELSEKILRMLEVREFSIEENGLSLLDGIITPIYRSTYKNLNLDFDENFDTYSVFCSVKKQKDIISGFFKFYQSLDLQDIKRHVVKTKPFIPEIINAITD